MPLGADSTAPSRYTCEIVFHSAKNVPLSDLNDLSSDPYIAVTLTPSLSGASGPKSDTPQTISFRTPTARRTLHPTFNARWIVSGIPASGFVLVLHLFDEDPGNHDDKLGKAVIRFPDPKRDTAGGQELKLKEGWDSGQREYKVHKRHGSWKTRIGTFVANAITRGSVGHRMEKMLDVYIPLDRSFISNRLQLTGPVPSSLRHRYVGFAPFIKAMFRARGIEGVILNRTLHKQHRAIYKWDRNTIWGVVGEDRSQEKAEQDGSANGESSTKDKPDEAFARKFLEMAAYGTEGRMFTYVILLDGEWRFTETGEEFAIQLLSKHTMHADVALEIAFSGEFFVRRVRKPATANGNSRHTSNEPPKDEDDASHSDHPDPSSLPPSEYELVIDNDSGTYRPRKELLPTLEAFLARPSNLGALGRIRAMDGFDERLKRWKKERQEVKMRARGGKNAKAVVRQASVSSLSSSSSSASSSSAEERQAAEGTREEAEAERHRLAEQQGKEALDEDGQRAKENEDDDKAAQDEEHNLTANKT
ncbi:hypothetical protein BN946_scf184801.g30 [Trametes cinnabarina]|uniref:C2 domain-containing protein n=1 Tax=Pycnoporus cinnabarinus TaxID=5643 RepID=A0A060S8P8_PYCCI|nr:hypothetical protein BN946_scf184801.g30 [Trametes cinnabarina]